MSDKKNPIGLETAPPLDNHSSRARSPWQKVADYKMLFIAFCVMVVATVYWGLIASDRYVSEAHVVVDKTDFQSSNTVDLGSLITGGRSHQDMFLLRDHLRSVDMLKKLESRLSLRKHYSNKDRDILSRLWFADASQEILYQHYLNRTSIEVDDQAGVLVIRAQAYDANTARQIAATLIEEGEAFLNNMAQQLAREQVIFLEQQVAQSNVRANTARRTLINYQNSTGMISPVSQAESLAAIAARLEGQISDLKARRTGMLGYLSPSAPDVAQLSLQIGALEGQMAAERKRLASPAGGTLNRSIEEFQRLESEVAFAQDVYRTALVGLERGRVEAVRMLKKLSVLQTPTLPEYPVEPRRIYNIMVFLIGLLSMLGVVSLLTTIIRDHQD
jgi:capsular polysaccharide transport system permease protein